ncbi:MAG: FAD binding domain-containing protein, partial [Acidimicrobiales bacterium]
MTHHVQLPSTVIDHVVTAGSLDEALAWLARPGTKPIAGGTDLMVELDRGQHRELATLVDLTRIPGLDRIERSGDTISIGPLVTHNQCVASELLRSVAVPLVQASWEVGSPQLRNRATIAGNIVTASPANDTLSALVALDAELTLSSTRGERRIAIADFHLGVRRTALEHGELVTAISFPALGADHRSIYLKLGLRRAQAISVVHVAVVARLATTGSAAGPAGVEEIRIALGSVAPTIVRATDAESMLVDC